MYNRVAMKKLYGWLATINFILPLIGYVLVTSIFLTGEGANHGDLQSESQAITIPYRFFTIIISLIVITLAPKKNVLRMPKQVMLLFFFWLFLTLRMVYDLFLRPDFLSINVNVSRTILFIPVCLLPAIAVLYSHRDINYKYAFHFVFWGLIVSLILMLINNPLLLLASDELVQRVAGNMAFSTLSLATFGASIVIMCYYAFKNHHYNIVLLFIIVLFAVVILLRAASRGPLVALFVVLIIYAMSSYKHPSRFVAIIAILFLCLFVFSDILIEMLKDVSPVLADRISYNESDDFTNGRAGLYLVGLEKFVNNPFLGDSFAIFVNDPIAHKHMIHVEDFSESGYIWSHNMVLDAFMGLGIIGGGIFLYIYISLFKKAFYLFKVREPRIWFVMLALLRVVAGFFSGAFYLNDSLTFCIVVVFLIGWTENVCPQRKT